MKLVTVVTLCSLMLQSAWASTVAVIDSGVDLKHLDLVQKAWFNEGEVADNEVDDEKNGYVDDVQGWNFAENNNEIIDYKYVGQFSKDVPRFFDIQSKTLLGTATFEEIMWMRSKIQDEEFVKELGTFANFTHGTHVAGISAKTNEEVKVIGVKLIPTRANSVFNQLLAEASTPEKKDNEVLASEYMDVMVKQFLRRLAVRQMVVLSSIASYVGQQKADIANGSFGTSFRQVRPLIGQLLENYYGEKPTEEKTDEMTIYFLDNLLAAGQGVVKNAPETLFVFAAGNDGTNNDQLPTSPANIKADNVITVAATIYRNRLAPFSNYGIEKVEVAAPGVAIRSTIPGDEHMMMSGTSQAAPYVSHVASLVKDTNPKLTPKEIKAILMGTVDKKAFLAEKVMSGGIVNGERAVAAARLAMSSSLEDAIKDSLEKVADLPQEKAFLPMGNQGAEFVLPLPMGLVL